MEEKNSLEPPSSSVVGLTETQLLSFYYNPELEEVDDFVDIFIKNTLDIPANDEFFRMLAQYADACRRSEQLDIEISSLTSQWESLKPTLWEQENRVITQRGKCGDGKTASGSQSVPIANFKPQASEKLQLLTNALNDVRFDKLASVLLETNFAKLQCQSHVQKCIHQFLSLNNVTPSHPTYVCFVRNVDPSQEATRSLLLHCLSVLFHFLREPLLPVVFVNDCKTWLRNLIGALNKFAYPQDHLVVLCHLLRCPQGFATWAKNFVQPTSHVELFDATPAVNHFLAMLNLLLSPVRKREQYLKGYMQTELENSWAIVDTDGDDESHLVSIPESDLLAVLSQFSFDKMLFQFFANLIKTEMTESRVLTLFAFELTVLKVLYEGLRTYNCTQYRQICKHIGLIMKKSVQYVAEFWQACRINVVQQSPVDLQFEFDRLFFRSVCYIVSSRRLGVWQFLVELPFDVVSPEFLYRIVYLLMNGENLSTSDVFNVPNDTVHSILKDVKKLEQRLIDLDETDAVYLLTALANIVCCSNGDDNLITPIVVQIFNACFVCDATRGNFHKSGRQLLANIAYKHLDVVQLCIDLIDEHLSSIGGYALELMAALPLSTFRIDAKRWKIVKQWLDGPLQSLSIALAQQILSSLNWKYETDDGRLFLDYDLHKDVAENVAKAHAVRCQIQSSMIGGSVKKAAKLASSVSGTINFEQQFDNFCWDLLLRLKLSPTDFNASIAQSIVESNFQNDKFDLTSFYVDFQLHCTRSDRVGELLNCLEKLIDNYQFKAAMACVCTAVPFLANDGLLLTDQRWLQCVYNLVHCDDSYLQYAKQLMGGVFPGENLQLLMSMLSYTISRFLGANFEKAEKFFRYWILLLCDGDLKSWNSNRSTLFVLDSLIKFSFVFDPTLNSVVKALISVYDQMLTSAGKQTKGFFSKIFGDEPPPEMLNAAQYAASPWTAFVSIKVEEFAYADLFDALNVELLRHPSQTLEQSLKKVCSKKGLAFPLLRLPVFQWLNLCCSLPSSHVLFPLVLQQFCVYFLRLVKVQDHSLPGDIFASRYETTAPDKFQMLITTLSTATSNNNDAATVDEKNLIRLFSAAKSWLVDERLRKTTRNLSSLDAPMKHLLESVFQNDRTFWSDFVDFERLRTEITKESQIWIQIRHLDVGKKFVVPSPSQISNDPVGFLVQKIKSNCQPIEDAPRVILSPSDLFISPDVNILCDFGKLSQILSPYLNILTDSSNSFGSLKNDVKNLNNEFFVLAKKLYIEIDTQITVVLKCGGDCVNPNRMKINVKCSKFNELYNRKLDENRAYWNGICEKVVYLMSENVPSIALSIISVVKGLLNEYSNLKPDSDAWSCLKLNGVRLFFRFVGHLNEQAMKFAATRVTFVQAVEILGQNLILGNGEQVEEMYNVLTTKNNLSGLLLPYFSPAAADVAVCHRLYVNLCNTKMDEKLWRAVLLKFEMSTILTKCSSGEVLQFFISTLNGCQKSYKRSDCVYEIYRQYFTIIAFWNFPQNFASYVDVLLDACLSNTATSPELLTDVVSKLGCFGCAVEYRLLPYVAFDLLPILTNIFISSKTSCHYCATDGLLHCWKPFASSVAQFCQLTFSTTLSSVDLPSSTVDCEEQLKKSFDVLCAMYQPWIEPNAKNGRIFLPWTPDDAVLAGSTIFDSFVGCLIKLQKLYEIMPPSSNNVYEQIWSYYVGRLSNFGDNNAGFVYDVHATQLLKLSWNNFWPNLNAMHNIEKSFVELPVAAHVFVTGLVVRIPWIALAQSYDTPQQPYAAKSAFYSFLLNILVRCASRKENYTACKASLPQLFNNLCASRWDFVDVARLNDVLKFVIVTYGADSIFAGEDDIRRCVLKLLEHVTQFLPLAPCLDEVQRLNRVERRRLFIRLLIDSLVEYTELKSASSDYVSRYVCDLLDRIELLVRMNINDSDKVYEASILLEEFISIWNRIDQTQFSESTQTSLFSWLNLHPDADVMTPLFTCCGRNLKSFPSVLTFQERILSAYFTRMNPRPTWSEISPLLVVQQNFTPNYVQECRNSCKFLSLYAYFMQKLPTSNELSDETIVVRDILRVLDILKEKQIPEAIIVLYVGLTIDLICRQLQFGGHSESVLILLNNLLDDLQCAVTEKSSGFLGSIGLGKKTSYSPRFKVFAALIISFMQQQIFAEREIRLSADHAVTNSKIQYVKSLKNNKNFAQYFSCIDVAAEFLTNTNKTFVDTFELYSQLVLAMYNEKFVVDKCQL